MVTLFSFIPATLIADSLLLYVPIDFYDDAEKQPCPVHNRYECRDAPRHGLTFFAHHDILKIVQKIIYMLCRNLYRLKKNAAASEQLKAVL